MKLKGLALAALFFVGTLMAPVQFSYSQTSPDVKSFGPPNLASIPSFTSGVVLLLSGSTAGEIIRMKLDALDTGDVTNLGLSVAEVAKLHQLLNDATKEERKNFKMLFKEYKKAVKLILKIGQDNFNKDLQKFSKLAIKIEKKIEKLQAKEEVENKIKHELKLSKKQRDLQRVKNHIGTLEIFLNDGPEKDKALAELQAVQEELQNTISNLKSAKSGDDDDDDDDDRGKSKWNKEKAKVDDDDDDDEKNKSNGKSENAAKSSDDDDDDDEKNKSNDKSENAAKSSDDDDDDDEKGKSNGKSENAAKSSDDDD